MLPLAAALFVAGCGTGSGTSRIASGGTRPVSLTPAQAGVVLAGLREMTGDPAASQTGEPKALSLGGEPGVHVCGNVRQGGKTYPYYIELLDKDGKPQAERGQLGSDASKRSKVAFMCRRHGGT